MAAASKKQCLGCKRDCDSHSISIITPARLQRKALYDAVRGGRQGPCFCWGQRALKGDLAHEFLKALSLYAHISAVQSMLQYACGIETGG